MCTLRLAGIAMLAVCMVSGIAASTSSAMKITYSGSGKFTVTAGADTTETVSGTELTCKTNAGTGQLGKSPATTAEVTISFSGCEALGKKCTSSGGTSGLIDTVKLLITFGEIETKKVGGALLKPASGTAFLVPVKCGEATLAWTGSVIGEFTTKLDTQTSLVTLSFGLKAGEKGKQAITKFVGEEKTNVLESSLEGGAFEVTGLESKEDLLLIGGSGQLLA
jgi:hypothetical protein